METRSLSPPATSDGLLPRKNYYSVYSRLIDDGVIMAYEIPSLEVHPPISLAGLSVSLPQPKAPKRLNVLTLIATLGIGISLCTELIKGRSIQIPRHPHLSISDT